MLNILAAAVVTSWVVIALLVLGYSRLVVEVRELQSRGTAGPQTRHPELSAPGPGKVTLVLALSGSCATCDTVFPEWLLIAEAARGDGHRTVTLSIDGSPRWRAGGAEDVLATQDLSAPFLLAYQPALIVIDDAGAVVTAEPIGSVETLRRKCSIHAGTAMTGAAQ